jgi:surface polysaccharide O-acyltransferase-like enzyme
LAVTVIVVGHWLAAAVTFRDGRLGNEVVLAVMPWTQWLTWIFQVVPVFFLVGGYANAVSWMRWRDAGGRREAWYRHRVGSVLGPTTVYLAVVLAVVAMLKLAWVNSAELALGTWAVAMHLWFVPVFLVVVSLTPIAVAAHRRWGLAAVAGYSVAVVIIDVLSVWMRAAEVGRLNYAVCWAAVYQIGIAWHGGGLRGRRPLVLALASAAVLTVLLTTGLYPVSMVGVVGARVQNTSPPTVALLAFATVQCGLLVAVAPVTTRWLARSRCRPAVSAANRNVMGLYLWHMIPVIAVAVVGYPFGLLPQPVLGSAAWWLFRAVWVGMLCVVTAAEMAFIWWGRGVFARDLPQIPVRWPAALSVPLLFAGVASAVVALWRIGAGGFAPGGVFPVAAALWYAAGLVLVSVVPSGSDVRFGRLQFVSGDASREGRRPRSGDTRLPRR